MQTKSCRRVFLVATVFFLCLQLTQAQKARLQIDYTVSLKDTSSQQFHVTTDIKNINQPRLDLSLPTWAPGWYTVENYFKNVLRFRITDANGKVLPHTMSKKQTWNVDTRGLREIRVDYDYQATVLALNQAKITKDFAFFQGIELFLEAVGHKNEPSTVHFRLPAGWKIISALKETSDPTVFTADNYDVLVDAPTEMGNFDVTRFEVEGKPHYFVANPSGAFSAEKSKRFTEMMAKVARADSTMFGGLPYDKYVMFYFFQPAESNASGALEHLNSFVAFAPPGDVATPEGIIGTAAHEYFHLWNVKRIRPAEMWPYDYSRENETPNLWVSEGFTNYYGNKARYRAGLMTPENFLNTVAGAASGIESDEARSYISPAESSVSTWVGYDTPVAFGISYYTQGQNLGALLDLSILNDTGGKRGLDDVMRALFTDFYKRGRGFTTEDMIGVIDRLTGRDYHEFFRRYVLGTEVPEYDRIFGYAGYRIEIRDVQVAEIGLFGRFRNGGITINGVEPNSPAAAAGLRQNDVITKINGQTVVGFSFNSVAGKTIKLTLNREGEEVEVPMTVGSRTVKNWELIGVAEPSSRQRQVRDAWLKRNV
jgi:predicted metalloprotease with PDZ domain